MPEISPKPSLKEGGEVRVGALGATSIGAASTSTETVRPSVVGPGNSEKLDPSIWAQVVLFV